MINLEVIALNIEDVIDINKTKATRIELCKNLEIGGLTPEMELIKESSLKSKLPIMVLVRPTDRSFVYTKQEFKQIIKSIKKIRKTKSAGIVVGFLKEDNSIDFDKLKKVIKVKKHLDLTFHRAFDSVENKLENAAKLKDLGVKAILSSGNHKNKIDGNISELVELNKVIPMIAGGGINSNNISELLKANLNYYHIGSLAKLNGKISVEIVDKIAEGK